MLQKVFYYRLPYPAPGNGSFPKPVNLSCKQLCGKGRGCRLRILAVKQDIFPHLYAHQLIRMFCFEV